MSANLLVRRLHYWATAFVALPMLVVIVTGVLLQVKKQVPWVQPPERRGSATEPTLAFEALLAAVRTQPGLEATGWDDVRRVDARPSRGMAKVVLDSGHEVQVDLASGEVLQTAMRRSDLIESLHDGSFFGGDVGRFGVFLPTAIVLFMMWCTGLWMFALPFVVRRRRAARAARGTPGA